MQYVEYIQTDGYCWFDTGIIPSIETKVEIVNLWPGVKSGDWPVYFGKALSDWDSTTYTFKSNNEGTDFDSRFGDQERNNYCPFAVDSNYNVVFDATGVTINNTLYNWDTTPNLTPDNHTLWLAAENNDSTGGDWDRHRASIAKFGEIKVWENNVLIGDFKPAVDNNNNVGFYDEVSQSFKANLGTGTPVAGPSLSSINVSASKNAIAASGETINIVVNTENAWSVSGATWLTLSSTGDTSGTTITATASGNNTGSARTETLVFTDSVTNDTAELVIKQKKVSLGQPFYLGTDEISEMFLGLDGILEAYLGDVLVFSSGPFMGLKLIPSSVDFHSESMSATTKVKSSEPWQITSNPSWITASPTSGDSGETIVSFVSDELSAATSGSVVFESASYSASLKTTFNTVQFVDAVRMSTAPNWNQYNALNTHIPVGDTGATIRVKYWGAGVFSDRVVGTYPLSPDADDYGIGDGQDFRYFPTMADAGSGRLEFYGYDTDGQYYDVTFGNLYVYDNLSKQYASGPSGPFSDVDTRTDIRIDMSVNWIAEVIITNNNNVIYDGKAAKVGNSYGMYDVVSNTFLTDANLGIVPRTAPTPQQQDTYLIMDISVPNDGAAHEYRVANSDNETISILKIDASDWSHECTDDPDGHGHGFYTDEFDDQGDLSQGFARWKIKGQFNGRYYIYADSVQLETAIPDYDGSEMVAYVDVSSDTMTTLSCYEEWDCRQNNPTCTWNPDTKSCDCGGE